MARNEELFTAICKGNRKAVEEIVQGVIDADGDTVELLNESMIPAMRDIGERFSRNEVYVPEMLIAARAMQTGRTLIEPLLAKKGHEPVGRVCVGTVKGVMPHYVLTERHGFGADLYVPASFIANVEHETIHLTLTQPDALQMGWEQAPRDDEAEPEDDLHRHI